MRCAILRGRLGGDVWCEEKRARAILLYDGFAYACGARVIVSAVSAGIDDADRDVGPVIRASPWEEENSATNPGAG